MVYGDEADAVGLSLRRLDGEAMDPDHVDAGSPPYLTAAPTNPCVICASKKLAPLLETQRCLMKEYGRDKNIPKVDAAPSEVRHGFCV